MSEIMTKFRIKYTSLKMVDDISVKPKQETQDFFDKLISDFRKNEPSDTGKIKKCIRLKKFEEKNNIVEDNKNYNFFVECCVTEVELQSLKDKTHRQLRLRELLLENSSQSTLVVMYVFITCI